MTTWAAKERETVAAHSAYFVLFAAPHRSDYEQLAAAEDFRTELLPVMPVMPSLAAMWTWLANEARAVLAVDGAL